ncbi:unnamed protein product [Fusarium equiseti]|uniref:Zn(2)-C6 fungal-type domain-containing protein n=1 Tax=Fusarium equiseti TaxID=61235 RepID=A0A8J2ND40_FUSEQ|nr:unnamed protein product [Fusarium equiseti]
MTSTSISSSSYEIELLKMMSDKFQVISTKPVRLRLACDACTTAKVRCSRTNPCERCEDNGMEKECCYSASRRHGKRARHRKTVSDTQRASSSSDTAAASTLTTLGFRNVSVSDFAWDDYCASGYSAEGLDGWSTQVDLDDMAGISWVDPWKALGFVSDTSPSGSSGLLSPDLNLTPEPILPSDPMSAINAPVDVHTLNQSHECEALALRLLQSLQCNDQTTQFCQQSHHNQPSCSMPSIDTVLSVNKAALANLIPLLKCSCAQSSHIAMLHSAILSKVIFWYKVAVTARYHTDGVALQPIKIQLGVLDLDEEDQATLQRTVLLRELRKAEKLMETFDSSYTGEEEMPSWHVSAVINMREELQGIIQRIINGQGGF